VWPDNETDVDLLGFDVLVVALTDERLLPLTVGVLGGWGSGKSSLLKQAYRELAVGGDSSPYVCVEFSPWKYEDYEDVKAALMCSVLDACETRAAGNAGPVEEIGKLQRFTRGFGRRGRAAGRVAVAVAPVVATSVLAAVDPHAAAVDGRDDLGVGQCRGSGSESGPCREACRHRWPAGGDNLGGAPRARRSFRVRARSAPWRSN
jgi:hypothetical protein